MNPEQTPERGAYTNNEAEQRIASPEQLARVARKQEAARQEIEGARNEDTARFMDPKKAQRVVEEAKPVVTTTLGANTGGGADAGKVTFAHPDAIDVTAVPRANADKYTPAAVQKGPEGTTTRSMIDRVAGLDEGEELALEEPGNNPRERVGQAGVDRRGDGTILDAAQQADTAPDDVRTDGEANQGLAEGK